MFLVPAQLSMGLIAKCAVVRQSLSVVLEDPIIDAREGKRKGLLPIKIKKYMGATYIYLCPYPLISVFGNTKSNQKAFYQLILLKQ